MLNLELNVGMACNNRCLFCMSAGVRPSERRWLPLEKAKAELRLFYERGCRSLGFLGGEPTAYPHLVEAVRFARELGYRRMALCTNGTRLADAAFVDRLVSAGVTRFGLSVHSHRPEVEAELTGLPGNLERKLAGLGHLLRWKALGRLPDNVSLNPVLNRRNMDDLESYLAFFGERGVDDVRFNFIWPQGRVERDRSVVPSYSEAMPQILRAMLRAELDPKVRLSFGGVPSCMLKRAGRGLSPGLLERLAERYLSEDGDLPTQVSLRGEDRFDWKRRRTRTLKTRAPACRLCRYRRSCEGVWGTYAALYGLGELSPVEA